MSWVLVTVVGAAVAGFAWIYVARALRLSTFVAVLTTPAVAASVALAALLLLRKLGWVEMLGHDARRGELATMAVPVFALAAIPALVGAFIARLRQRREGL